jgi:hypothetical protein
LRENIDRILTRPKCKLFARAIGTTFRAHFRECTAKTRIDSKIV